MTKKYVAIAKVENSILVSEKGTHRKKLISSDQIKKELKEIDLSKLQGLNDTLEFFEYTSKGELKQQLEILFELMESIKIGSQEFNKLTQEELASLGQLSKEVETRIQKFRSELKPFLAKV